MPKQPKGTGEEGSTIPSFIWDLQPYVDTLVAFAKDPRVFIKTVIATVFVGWLLEMGLAVANSVLAVFDALLTIPEAAGTLLGDSGTVIANSILAAGEWYVGTLQEFAVSLGPFGPFFLIGGYALTVVIIARAIPPLMRAITDLLGAIPVVGSILDAALSFAVDFGFSLTRGDR